MQATKVRDTILFVRVTKGHLAFLDKKMKRLGVKSRSAYIDMLLQHEKADHDRLGKHAKRNRKKAKPRR